MGLALGELRYFIWNEAGGKARGVLRAIVDPFGEIESALGTKCSAVARCE